MALAQRGDAVATDSGQTNDYSAIWLRNVFDLKPVPPPPAAPEAPVAPPPDVKLTGLMELFHVKRAAFLVKKKPESGKPPTNLESSYILAEGQRQDMLEVVSIDLPGKIAKIKLDDAIIDIRLETNAVPTGGGGMHAGYNQRAAANAPLPPPVNNGIPNGAVSTGRMVRPSGTATSQYSPDGSGGVQPLNQGGYAGGGYAGGNYVAPISGTPGLSLPGNTGGSTSPAAAAAEQNVPAEVTTAILAAQQAVAQSQGRAFPPIPPPYDLSGQNNQNNNQNSQSQLTPPTTVPTLPINLPTVHGNFK